MWLSNNMRIRMMHLALQALAIKEVATKPFEGQKTGTSGLRKKTKASRLRGRGNQARGSLPRA
jgi:hypothetical protein